MKWEVKIVERCTTIVTVEADSEEEAIEKINSDGSWHGEYDSRDYEWEETTAEPVDESEPTRV